jgi:alkylation response protein AidB-like acyl-CoA dehydrogenase
MLNAQSGGSFLLSDSPATDVFIPEEFTSEDRLIAQSAEAFLRNDVLPHVARIESGDHEFMADLMRSAGNLGLLGADVPEEYGGLGLSQRTAALIAEKLNPQQSFALTHEAHTVIGTLPLLYFGNHDQKSRYLPKLASGEWIASFALSEANSGSDALAMQTRATLSPDGRHWILNGEKMWITNTAFASLFTVFGKVDGQKVSAFLVERDTPGLSFGREEHKLGMHGTSTRRVILENVHVPVENGLAIGKGQYAAFCALNLGRFKLEAGAVGGLKYLLSVCTEYAGQRKAFGRSLSGFGLVQRKLATMAAKIFALESMVYRLAGELDGVFEGIVPTADDASDHYHRAAEELTIECNIVKVIGSEAYSAMADEAIQIHGGYGYTEEFPVARAWRDQRLLRIGEGANEIVRIAIVNTLLRRDRQKRLAVLSTAAEETNHLVNRLDEVPGDEPESVNTIAEVAENARILALYLIGHGHAIYGDALLEQQEITGAIADVVCSVYGLESLHARCAKLTAGPRAETSSLLGLMAARELAGTALTSGRYAIDSLPLPDDDLLEPLGLLLESLDPWQNSPVELSRAVAAKVIESGGYLF